MPMESAQDEADNVPDASEYEEGDDPSAGPERNGQEDAAVPHEEQDASSEVAEASGQASNLNGTTFAGFKHSDDQVQDTSVLNAGNSARLTGLRTPSLEESLSISDDTPSLQDSISSPKRRLRLTSPHRALRPFDHRFQSRLSLSPLGSPWARSSAFLSPRSRRSSVASQLSPGGTEPDKQDAPWDAVRWTKLRKLSGEAFSEIGKRNYGRPTCIAVAGLIALGTSKGMILIFDPQQELKATIGLGTTAMECGAVTAIALAADHTTVASGHANGSIFTWEIAKPAKPFLSIPSAETNNLIASGNDGHVRDASVVHLSFLGTRHTALVSADNHGMAFSHLASRGLGAVSRTMHTKRILGRYPESAPPVVRPKKPSSVLAFSSLPLGNLESATDNMGLVAMLTPYLLVVVSATPVAQTQHKASRPKELAAHGALTAALAWYPAMRSTSSPSDGQRGNAKLAYCWLNVLIVLEVEISEGNEADVPSDLYFRTRRKWKANESIVAMQWLGRSVLAVVTITQQLLIFEDDEARITESSDLIKKHIYHADVFSQQLSQLVEKLDEEDTSMHGVVADAFYMSFKAYKGRLFLLGFNEVCIGALASWTDRLLALMEHGDFIGAIQLATAFYTGTADKATVGLSSDDNARHEAVRDKLCEMMHASLKYAFGKNPVLSRAKISSPQLQLLVEACFVACLHMKNTDFLFEDVYDWYVGGEYQHLFLHTLETFISSGDVKTLPPSILKDLVNHFVATDRNAILEEMLCRLSPETMDIDQVTGLCKTHGLYDALFYVWSRALEDYTSIMKDLLEQAKAVNDSTPTVQEVSIQSVQKVFPYLSYTLTGRVYPIGDSMPSDTALLAKADIYHFFFSGNGQAEGEDSFPYLRSIMHVSTPNFMSMLNEAFEDDFLNGASEQLPAALSPARLSDEQRFGLSINRQYILTILLEISVAPEFEAEEFIYLDMFIARNLPKFPQFILLPGNVLHRVFVGLCSPPTDDITEDCELSVEYLLSVYQPPDLPSLVPLLRKARFFRVIKSIHQSEREFDQLLEACFEDIDHPDEVFQCIAECLRRESDLTPKQVRDVRRVITANLGSLTTASIPQAATTIGLYAPDLHPVIVNFLEADPLSQFQYLREILEGEVVDHEAPLGVDGEHFVELYVRLMCDFDRGHVRSYVDGLKTGDLRLSEVLPSLEQSGAIDAAVVLIARGGKIHDAMRRLVQHLRALELALTGLLEGASHAPDTGNANEAATDLIDSLEKYVYVGIGLCRGQTKTPTDPRAEERGRAGKPAKRPFDSTQPELLPHECMWLDLVDATVRIAKNVGVLLDEHVGDPTDSAVQTSTQMEHKVGEPFNASSLQGRLRNLVQDAFTALLNATSTDQGISSSRGAPTDHPPFLRILRAFLARAASASPSLAHLRQVLSTVFAAYAYEEGLLALANRLLEKDLFMRVETVTAWRKRGWRPLGQVCGGCGARVWGPGVNGTVWDAWLAQTKHLDAESGQRGPRSTADSKIPGKVKGRAKETQDMSGASSDAADSLVVFSCRHLFHRRCLDHMIAREAEGGNSEGAAVGVGIQESAAYRCPLEVDGDTDSSS